MSDLIDTTEMYLKALFELQEDHVAPMRARIVERLGHSGPTVSQTVARMERDDLLRVRHDRQVELTAKGRDIAIEVIRKHRFAERLLVDVIGMDWALAHEEACRWEHVMSDLVEDKVQALLKDPDCDPYGNPIPGSSGSYRQGEVCVLDALHDGAQAVTVVRFGEPIQANPELLRDFMEANITLESVIDVTSDRGEVWLHGRDKARKVAVSGVLARHLFVVVS